MEKSKKSKKIVFIKYSIGFLLILTFFIVTYFLLRTYVFNKDKLDKDPFNFEMEVKLPEKYSLDMMMVGDALIHDSIFKDAYVDGVYDFTDMIDLIKPISSSYDLSYYNQETIFGGEEFGYSNYPLFNTPSEYGDAMIDAGFNLVSLANNHTMDKGVNGVLNSVEYWRGTDVVTAGQYSSFEDKNTVRVYEENGITYGFLSYTTLTNGLNTPKGKEYLNDVYSYELASSDISLIKDEVDVIIVAMHWGNEYSHKESTQQIRIANELSSLGTDIIIGTHSHVVQPIEYINNGETLVIYSLGNFISDQEGVERLSGLMLGLTIEKYVDTEGNVDINIGNLEGEMIYTDSDYSGRRDFKVYPYSQLTNQILPNYITYRETYQDIVASKGIDITWGMGA